MADALQGQQFGPGNPAGQRRIAGGVHAQLNAVNTDDPVTVHNHRHY